MASRGGVLYTGVTNDLARRVWEHKQGEGGKFRYKYRVHHLVHWEEFLDARQAIAREKQIKGWVRRKKTALIAEANPQWADLAADWYGPAEER